MAQGFPGPGLNNPQYYPPPKEAVPWYQKLLQTVLPGGETGYGDIWSGTSEDPSVARQIANIGIPLEVGRRMHDYQKDWLAKQPKFPGDETKIDFKTAREYMDDPKQRFKPKELYADTAAMAAEGGRIGAQEGGLMNLGGMEKDYRQEGGFVPIGGQEKADDVPARLSKNEFVFTADAVRAAGGGDIDAGAEVMENVMENLEAGGRISEESQGLEGARDMFANAQQLEKRII